jgi:FKBP-type peptidyl-prolyl cis-trans isomerase FklB
VFGHQSPHNFLEGKSMRLFATVVCACIALASSASGQEATQILKTPGASAVNDAASYGIGYDIGMNISAAGFNAADISQTDIVAGIMDALGGKEPAVQPEAIQAAMEKLGQEVMGRKKAEAAKFLEENKKQDGVQVLPNGLQYKVLKSGSGATPTADSTVTVHYEGKLTNGEIFDSSIRRGEPTSFGVSQVIPGWTQALLRMKVGDKWQLVIPPELAYGEQGSRPVIGPNETLIFEVELLEVK